MVEYTSREDLIRGVAQNQKIDAKIVRRIYDTLETLIYLKLSGIKTPNDGPYVIRLFKGITLKSEYIPEKTQKLNFTSGKDKEKKEVVSPARIRVRARVTRDYNEKASGRLPTNW